MNTILDKQAYLLKYDIKPSVQRLAILDYLVDNRTHPTADEIYCALHDSIPTLSKTTVYNTLKLFAEQGVLLSIVIDEKNVRFDIDTSNHAHFQCLGCGCVYDIPVENINTISLDKIGELTITEIHLYYKGYCKPCLQERFNKKNG